MIIQFRKTTIEDLDFVLIAENQEENRNFVFLWSENQHRYALSDSNVLHFIIETSGEHKISVGYLIIAGINDPNQNIEFKRIVITQKSRGFGREAVRFVKRFAFEKLKAHRIWLDAIDSNERAISLYKSEGFRYEGTLRKCLKTNEGHSSLIIMSILKDEYLYINSL
jgi:diamine N-acetyltransferase